MADEGRREMPISTTVFKLVSASAVMLTALTMAFLPAQAAAPDAPMQTPEVQTLETEVLDEEITHVMPPSEISAVELPPPPPPEPEPEPRVFTPPENLPPPEPGTAQAYAKDYLAQAGFGESEFSCLVSLWNRESGWNYLAMNQSSGAYGIPQSLPGNKMASAGDDWETNPETQIRWGVSYITNRYGSPCGAWAHSEANNWY